MATDSLEDGMVKLVGYAIVSVKRGEEQVMPGGEGTIVVTANMTAEAFIAWMIGRYIGSEDYQKMSETERQSHQKYLRVHYNVTRRWPREPIRFEERQIEELDQIRQALESQDLPPDVG